MAKKAINNLLTFDVEDYYQIFYRNYFKKKIDPSEEVVRCTDLIIKILAEYETKATFFVVGNVAEKYPDLIKRLFKAGHEIASHGNEHIYVNRISPAQFQDDLLQSVKILGDLTGKPPVGFRAPQFSIDSTTHWAFEIMSNVGFKYDSSFYPGRNRSENGVKNKPYDIYTKAGKILEIPMSFVAFAGRVIPAAGGGFLRMFPFWFNRWAIDKMNMEGRKAVVYMHPYEFEKIPQPIEYGNAKFKKRATAWLMHVRQLYNRDKSITKLKRLLKRYQFTSIAKAFEISN